MGDLLMYALCFGAGLIVGWVVLPAPAFVQKFWADYGWAKPTSAL